MKLGMQESNVYEYAVIRFVPKVEREEFFNIGLILFSKKEKFIRIEFSICQKKFALMADELDLLDLEKNLESFENIANGTKAGGEIAKLEIPERFRWLTAVRSSVVQTSRPHPGKTFNLDNTFERLFKELVK